MTDAIFIGGCGRSGTTMLGGILGASKYSFTTPESHFKVHFLRSKGPVSHEILSNNFSFGNWQVDLENFEDPLTFENLLNKYQLNHNLEDKRVWVDHTPENFRLTTQLVEAFPTAKFIHIVRDPRAVANSIMRLSWGPNNAFEAAKWWVENVSFGFHAQIKYPEKVILTKYEDIVRDPTGEIQKLADFVGLPFEESMLRGSASFLPSFSKTQHNLVGKSPDQSKIDEWKRKLNKKDIREIELICHSHLGLLELELSSSKQLPIKSYMPIENFRYGVYDFFSYLANWQKNRRRKKK